MASIHLKNSSTAQIIRKGKDAMTNHLVPMVAVINIKEEAPMVVVTKIKEVTKANEDADREREKNYDLLFISRNVYPYSYFASSSVTTG